MSQMLISRRRYDVGPNFDIVAGIDLLDEKQQKHLWQYMRSHKPLVAIISTPCRGLMGWSGINKLLHPESWKGSRREPLLLGAIGADVAQFQLDNDRDYLSENPRIRSIQGSKRMATGWRTPTDESVQGGHVCSRFD